MSQDNLIKLQCGDCKRVTHFSRRNKKLKVRLELRKHCRFCRSHRSHKETK